MATLTKNFFSIVLIGRHNPQILNHDFLVKNDVLPRQEPFLRQDLPEGEKPFTRFFSTPPVTQISYGKFTFIVQEDRFQAVDETGKNPANSPIIAITKKYFGELLVHTPLTVGGLNFNCTLVYTEPGEEDRIDAKIGINLDVAREAFRSRELTTGMTAAFPFAAGQMSVVTSKRLLERQANLNFNYEFKEAGGIQQFLSHIDTISQIASYAEDFWRRLGIAL